MNDKQAQDLIDANFRCSYLLGITSAIMYEYKRLLPDIDHTNKADWFMDAIQAVVYENKAVPPFPPNKKKERLIK